jgi:hypothetical protein
MISTRTALSIAVGMCFALGASNAFAQDTTTTTPTQPAATGELPPPKVTTSTTVGAGAGGAPHRAEDEDPTSDHEKVVGHIGVGYFGFTNVRIATGPGNATGTPSETIPAPTIGVRYWLGEKMGLDLGIGIGFSGGSSEAVGGTATQSIDQASKTAFAFHGGVPLVFAHQKHYKFLLVPELNVAVASSTLQAPSAPGAPTNPEISLSGFHIDVGARIGAEVHFGFIGVPQLSLQASVGLLARRDSWKASADINGTTVSSSQGVTAFGTTVQADPWAIFVNNISAIYYLP